MGKKHSKHFNMLGTKVIIIFVLSAIFMYCESYSTVGNVKKCGISDGDCQQKLYRSIAQVVANSGIPEMGIPKIDPFEVKNMEMTIMGLLKVGTPEGVVKGFKTCISNKFVYKLKYLTMITDNVNERKITHEQLEMSVPLFELSPKNYVYMAPLMYNSLPRYIIDIPTNNFYNELKKWLTEESVYTDPENLVTSIELVCEKLIIEGQYTAQTTPALAALIGGIKIHGEGKSSIVIENLQLNLEVPFEIRKLEDCELHAVMDKDKITYTYKILGKTTLAIDNLYVGSQEISAVAVNIFNENWKFFSNTFGGPIIDNGLEVFVVNANKFFANVPIKDLVSDDLSAHVTH